MTTTLTSDQRLDRLARDDKWYLSAGDGILWAPAFPVWLHTPGFWDEAHVYYHPFAPLFSVAIVDGRGYELPLKQISRNWRPDRLVCRYQADNGAVLVETREALGRGRFASTWNVETPASDAPRTDLHLVAYTAQPGDQVTDASSPSPSSVRWRRALIDRREQKMEIDATLSVDIPGVARPPTNVRIAAVRSEGSAVQPQWRFTPFAERWEHGRGLREEVRLEGISPAGLVYAAIDVPVSGLATLAARAVRFTIELVPVESSFQLDPGCAITSPTQEWSTFLQSFPTFRCSDPHLEKYYDYRLYGLRLCRLEGGAGNVKHPAIAEGISYFHVPITYSGQCHMFEMRWSTNPDVARGTLLNFIDNQKDDGSFHGRIYTNHLIGTDFYLASWGDAALAVDSIHPDDGYLRRIHDGLARHARWMDSTRDGELSGMYDVINHFETGQEYMSRYQSVNPKADLDGWKDSTKLKAIDATVYAYLLHRALARIADRLGTGESADWGKRAERVGRALLERMWNERTGMFSDVDPRTGKITGVEAAVCFYPMLTDLLTENHLARMLDRLTDPAHFGTPYPVPSSALSDPLFNADAEWKGKRHVCPWNGRVWPMTNSHIIDGLMRQWRLRDGSSPTDRPRHRAGAIAGDFLARFVRMMYHDGDLARPNCYEHYNPLTGHTCEYRGIDDYQHSWVVDLIIRGVMGIDPGHTGRSSTLTIDPLPMPAGAQAAAMENLRIAGHTLSVRRGADNTFEVTHGGRTTRSTIGRPLTIDLA
jgi:hypothetical protein